MSIPLEPLPLATLRNGQEVRILADADMRAAIAKRLRLPAVHSFEATAHLEVAGDVVTATGKVTASVEQACTATGEPVAEKVDEAVVLRFAPQPRHEEDEEIELGEGDLDTIFHDGRTIALGDALVDTLALALDPYPRVADADARLKAAGVLSEEEAGAFGVLADLKKRMEKGGD